MVAACHSRPAPGGACRTLDPIVCVASGSALVCEGAGASAGDRGQDAGADARPGAAGAWVAVPCHGARGCTRRGEADECDDTTAAAGDACPRNPPLDYACTADHAQALVCEGGRYALWRACRGPEGCSVEGGRNIHCDTTLGEPGDPCARAGTYACAVDRQTLLVCDGARAALKPASSCRGPKGCQVERDSRKVDCDDDVAQPGDPCDQEGRIACALDHKAELSCSHGKYDKKRDCRRSDCRLDDNELFCD